MSLAKKCDRCKNLYEPKDADVCGAIINGLSLISRDKQNLRAADRRYFDLCPECLLSLANWLKNGSWQADGLEPISGSDKVFVKLCSEKENDHD